MSFSLLLISALSSSIPIGLGGDKAGMLERMASVAREADALESLGSDAARAQLLRDEYCRLSALLGGDEPASARAAPSSHAVQPQFGSAGGAGSGAQRSFGAVPPGTVATTTSFTNATLMPLPDAATTLSLLTVSGLSTRVWDIDLEVFITHTYSADLDLRLTSPTGKSATVTTDNGGAFDDVFNGTRFDDSAAWTVTDYPYVDHVTATPLTMEGALDRFRGDDPNGVWTLSVTDDQLQDVGDLHAWSLHITTLDVAPGDVATATFGSSPMAPIPDPGSVIDPMYVSMPGGTICRLRVHTRIFHPTNTELDLTLTSPMGTKVVLTSDNGYGADDGFSDTWFYDAASVLGLPLLDDPVTDHAFINFVAATDVVPEGALAQLLGEDPNGAWTLNATDDTGNGIAGTFQRWEMVITTCAGGGTTYCTAKLNSLGCVPAIVPSGGSSATATSGYLVEGTNVRNHKPGVLFYGIHGAASIPYQGGTLCVSPQIRRATTVNSGGGPGNDCSGVYTIDMNAFAAGVLGGGPLPALGVPGTTVNCQWWGRDPGFPPPDNATLTDGLEYVVGP